MTAASPTAAAKARLFVALDLPEPVVEALLGWRGSVLRDADALRAVPRESLHVTLAFLGWKPEEAIAPLSELVETCASAGGGAAGLALGEPLWLPRRRPRVLAVALEDRHGQLASLQAQLVQQLVADGWYELEARPYLPHVTVARVRGGTAPRAQPLPDLPQVAFDGAAVVLYRSRLSSAGSRYEPLSVNRLA